MLRALVVAATAAALTTAGAVGIARPPAEPPTLVGTAVPALTTGGDVDRLIESLERRVGDVPTDDSAWSALALAYIEKGRLTEDGSYYERADRSVARSLALRPDDNPPAVAVAGALAAARHDFAEALRLVDRALAINPYQPVALAIRVDALTELGRYGDQLRALEEADRRRPAVAVATRYAYALELRGDLEGSLAVLRRSLASAAPGEATHLLTLVADLERRLGRLDAARRSLARADRLTPGYLPAIVSSARLETASGRLDDAILQWEAAVATAPLPGLHIELGELHLSQDRRGPARAHLAEAARLLEEGGSGADLESAQFHADHGDPGLALSLAEAEWARSRSVHAADALGWALFRVGRPDDALPLLRRATRLGTEEPHLWLHRGTVEAAVGLEDTARRHLERALAMDAGFSPWQTAQARGALDDLG